MSNPNPKPPTKPTYISSSGNVLESPPLSARVSRAADDIYNFFGLYFVSLFSLDPYTAAQNSQFNTRGRPNTYQDRPRWGTVNRAGGPGGVGAGVGGSAGAGAGAGSGPRGGDGSGFGGGGSGRRIGTVDDVRGPECGSCG